MRLQVADLGDESVWAIVLALGNQARHDNAVCRSLAQAARPPLGGRQRRAGVQDEKEQEDLGRKARVMQRPVSSLSAPPPTYARQTLALPDRILRVSRDRGETCHGLAPSAFRERESEECPGDVNNDHLKGPDPLASCLTCA